LWELVAGKKVFEGKHDIDVIRRVAACEVPRLSTNTALDDVVARMLSRDREARYPTLADAAIELARLLPAGHAAVQAKAAALVESLVGESIRARTKDLGTAGALSVVEAQAPSRPTQVSQQSTLVVRERARVPRRFALGVAAGALASVAALAVVVVVRASSPPPKPALSPPAAIAGGTLDDASDVIPAACTTHQFYGAYCDDDDDAEEAAVHDTLKLKLGVELGCGNKDGSPAFCPMARATRAEVVYALTAAAGIPLNDHPDAFDDDNGDPHEQFLNAAAAFGIVTGPDRRVHPRERIEREEIARMMCRMYRLPTPERDYFFDDDGSPDEPCHNALAAAHVMIGRPLPGRMRREFRADATESRGRLADLVVKAHDANLTPVWSPAK
jgi:hypothetical protein